MSNEKPETFRGHLPALAGSVIGTLISAVIGSHAFGTTGTRYALVVGALISGSVSWWGERAIRRSQTVAHAKIRAAKSRRRELTPEETQHIEAVHEAAFDARNRGVHYRTIAILALTALTVSLLTVAGLDALGSRQVATFTPAPTPTVTKTQLRIVPADPTTITVVPSTRLPESSPGPSVTPSASATPAPSPDSTLATGVPSEITTTTTP